MLRPFILKAESDLKALADQLLRARTSQSQAEAAHARLAEANPHLDPDKIAAGTVVLVPDLPGFKTAATTSIQSGPFGEFSDLLSGALEAAAERAKGGAGDREKQRADVAAT